MSRYPYHTRFTDNRNRRDSGTRSMDALRTKPYGQRQMVRPVILGTSNGAQIQIAAYNVIKPDDSTSVFANNRGPIETVATQEQGQELWCKFSEHIDPLTASDLFTALKVTVPEGFATYVRGNNQRVEFSVKFKQIIGDYDPSILTYTTRPQEYGTAGAGLNLYHRDWDYVSSGDQLTDAANPGFLVPRCILSLAGSGYTIHAASAPSDETFRINSTETPANLVDSKIRVENGHADNEGIVRVITAYTESPFTVTVSPPFPEDVQPLDSVSIWPLYTGVKIWVTCGSTYTAPDRNYGRLEELTGITVEKYRSKSA